MEERKGYISKYELRSALIERRKSVTDAMSRSDKACARLLPLLSGNVMVYVSMGSELPTDKLIDILLKRDDITVFAPYTKDGEITPKRLIKCGEPDKYGNMPDDCYGETGEIDVCVTPMLGFDGSGYRIGYGRGYYDGFFVRSDARRIGLAYAAQRTEFVHEEHDIPLDACVTEDEVIVFNARYIR